MQPGRCFCFTRKSPRGRSSLSPGGQACAGEDPPLPLSLLLPLPQSLLLPLPLSLSLSLPLPLPLSLPLLSAPPSPLP